ncbi:MAG: hypothetical protein QM740_04840 [Acidovorax sp.]
MTADLAARQLQNLQDDLLALRDLRITSHAFSTAARGYAVLLAALPPRFEEVLLGLLDRLESSALFAEESCSFSQKDLLASLQMWLDKAQEKLPKSPEAP